MKQYHIQSGFIAKQFEKPKYCVGIERNALRIANEYEITIGDSPTKYFLSYEEASKMVEKYGRFKMIRPRGKLLLFIIPVEEMRKEVKGISKVEEKEIVDDVIQMFK